MALSDCIKCWMTPCECGHEYQGWSIKRKIEQIEAIMGEDKKEILEKLNQNEDEDLEEVLKKLEGMKPSIIQEYIDKQREINFNINNQNKDE